MLVHTLAHLFLPHHWLLALTLNHKNGHKSRLKSTLFQVKNSSQFHYCSAESSIVINCNLRPISERREWLRTMTLKSALVDGHLHARCLVCLQPARKVIPGQTLAIGYGRSRVALGRSNSFKLQQTPAFK